jgi:hypothetical protein
MSNELIAYCGLYCGACSFKVAFEENDREHLMRMPPKYDYLKNAPLEFCPGCRLENKCGECAIRDCAIEKKVAYCSLCDEFPCDKLKRFSTDGIPHHAESIENLKESKTMGSEKLLTTPKAQWMCTCTERYSWYLKRCKKCGMQTKRSAI